MEEEATQDLIVHLFEIMEKYESGLLNSDQALNMGLEIIGRIRDLSYAEIQDMMNDWRATIKS